MLDKITDNSFLSPLVAFTFIPMAVTGILLLFHVRFPAIKDIHDWLGLAFLISVAFHLAVNWTPMIRHLNTSGAKSALILAVALIIVCCIFGFNSNAHGKHKGSSSYVERY